MLQKFVGSKENFILFINICLHSKLFLELFRFFQNIYLQKSAFSIYRLDEAKKYRQIDRDQINKLNQLLADHESEINMLRRSLESLETERARDRATIQRLQNEVDKLRIVRISIYSYSHGRYVLFYFLGLNGLYCRMNH